MEIRFSIEITEITDHEFINELQVDICQVQNVDKSQFLKTFKTCKGNIVVHKHINYIFVEFKDNLEEDF